MTDAPAAADRDPLLRVLDAVLLLTLVLAPTQASVQVLPDVNVSPTDPLLALALLLLATHTVRRRAWGELRWPPLPAWIFCGVTTASIAVADNRLAAIKETIQAAQYFLAGWLLFATRLQDVRFRRQALLTASVVTTGVLLWAGVHWLDPARAALDVRAAFGNRNVLGGFLALAVPVLAGVALTRPTRWQLAVPAGLAAAVGVTVNLAGGTALALAVGLLVVALSRRHAWLAWLALAVGLLALGDRLLRPLVETWTESAQLFPDGMEMSRRYPEWQAGWLAMREHPFLGVGAGNYQSNIGMYYGSLPNPTGPAEPDTQNLYVVLGVTTGLAGLLAFAALLGISAARAARRALRTCGAARGLYVGLTGAVLAFACNALWAPLLVRGLGIPLVFLLVLASTRPAPAGDVAQPRALNHVA